MNLKEIKNEVKGLNNQDLDDLIEFAEDISERRDTGSLVADIEDEEEGIEYQEEEEFDI